MEDRKIPETLEEAYRLRDTADSLQERDFYQEQVYYLRREEYRSRGIRTEISSRRRERQSAIEFSREMFFLEVAEISGQRSGRPGGREARVAQHEARRYATRLDTHAFLKQLASPHSGAVELYRRNYLELLRMGKSPSEAYYLSRVIGLAGEGEFRHALQSVRETGYPSRGGLAYAVALMLISAIFIVTFIGAINKLHLSSACDRHAGRGQRRRGQGPRVHRPAD